MKRTRLIVSFCLLPAVVIPLTLVTKCAVDNDEKEQEKTLIEKIKQDAINEFIELSKYSRRTGYTYPVYKYLTGTVLPKLGYELQKNITFDSYLGAGATPGSTTTQDWEKTNGNFWFDIPTNAEYAKVPKIAIQVPIDMVLSTQTDEDYENACKNGIEVVKSKVGDSNVLISKDNKTSIGKSGLMVGLVIALLKNKEYKHGPLRIIFTTDSEKSLLGAKNLGRGLYDPSEKKKEVDPALTNIYGLINLGQNADNEISISMPGTWYDKFINVDLSPISPSKESVSHFYRIKIENLLSSNIYEDNSNKPNINNLAGEILYRMMGTQQINKVLLSSYKTNAKTYDEEGVNVLQQTSSLPTGATIEFASNIDSAEFNNTIEKINTWFHGKYKDEANATIKGESEGVTITKVIPSENIVKYEPINNSLKIIKFLKDFDNSYTLNEDGSFKASQTLTNVNIDLNKSASVKGYKHFIATTTIRTNSLDVKKEIANKNTLYAEDTLSKIKSSSIENNYQYTKSEELKETDLIKLFINKPYTIDDPTNNKLVQLAQAGIKEMNGEPKLVNSLTDNECSSIVALPYKLADDRKIQFISLGCRVDNLYTPNETIYTDNLDKLISAIFSITHNFSL